MPNFTYITGIPAASHNPSVDQPDMQINTNSIDDIIEVDHYSFNDNNGGYHKKVSLVNNAGPFPTPAGVGSLLYGSNNEWIFTNASLVGAGIQMTRSDAFPVATTTGRSFLPGGIIIQWGQATTGSVNPNIGTVTVNFAPAFSTLFVVNSTVSSSGDAIVNVAANNSQATFIVKNGSGTLLTNRLLYWIAIGN